MGIYSKDRTMLTIDPMAESTSMPGYTSALDLYKILEETMSNDLIIFNSLLEMEVSIAPLDEADSAKVNRRAASLEKLLKGINIQLANASAKVKSVCAGVNKKVESFNSKKVDGVLDKYSAKFNNNSDIMISAHFAMKYNKEALECTDAEIAKFIMDAAKAGQAFAKNASSIAKTNAAEINKSRNDIFKIADLSKYAEKFCCCCEEKSKTVSGNPFSGSVSPKSLTSEIKNSPKVNFEKAIASMDAAFNEVAKQVKAMQASVAKDPDKVTADDLATAHALAAVANGLIKAYIHMINDAYKCYVAHTKECVKVYIAASNIKAIKEGESVVYRATISSLTEADLLAEEFDFILETDEVDNDHTEEAEKSVPGENETSDANVKDESCKKEACKEAAEPSLEPLKEDYLKDIPVHKFKENKSILECGVEICLMAEANWIQICEELGIDEYDNYCKGLAKGMIESEALKEADEGQSLKEKVIASIKKIAEYVYGLYSKIIVSISNTLTKYKFLFDKEALEREAKGLANLIKDKATISGLYIESYDYLDKEANAVDEIFLNIKREISKNQFTDQDKIQEIIKERIVEDYSAEKNNFKEALLDKLLSKYEDSPYSEKILDRAQESIQDFKANKIRLNTMFGSTKKIFNTAIAEIKAYGADDDSTAKKCKELHQVATVISQTTSIFLTAISKEFATSCKIVLSCYNAGGKKQKEEAGEGEAEKAEPVNASYIESKTSESIESLFGLPAYM